MNATLERNTGWHGPALFFDATCGMCRSAAERWRGTLEKRGVAVLPLQSAEAKAELNLRDTVLPDEMKFVIGGQTFGGADALIEIARRIWWARPLALLAAIPGVRNLLRRAYQIIAARRYCLSGACRIVPARSKAWRSYALLAVLPMLVLPARGVIPDWAFMWALAGAVFAGCKWLAWMNARGRSGILRPRSFVFLVGWVGMNAEQFLDGHKAARPSGRDWISAFGKTLIGVFLIWSVARILPADAPLVRGWCGLLGIVFLLHFGLFHLLALFWRRCGIDARAIMRAPLFATSLSDFWSRRWNLAFHQLAEREIFKPLLRRTSGGAALFVTFLISGLIHDAVISFPARGGYGMPTAYFILQGVGILIERSVLGKRMGLNYGWRGRAFAWVFTLAPVTLLFHEPFITQIILPFLKALGAL